MRVWTRNALRLLEQNRHVHDERHERSVQSAHQRWSVLTPARVYRVYGLWQRAVSALVALTLFAGPLSITFEQSRDAAGVLAAGSTRLDDEAWQQIQDLAGLRVHFTMQEAQAAPIVDPTAPISFQPKITRSTGANGGVPVVNITAPNAAGISLNQYQSFNIDPVGLILNNSLMSGTSLTGGDVQANPNLSGRTASVIVNQVTSTGAAFASLLNGPLEVFGAPATVIIANPNGITTHGTGFTNTIGVTLSTGTPQFLSDLKGSVTDFNNAQAIGYSVTGGHIQIEGNAGVNGPGAGIEGTVGTIDLIGETIGINAPLYAGQRINAIAGRQFVLPSAVTASGTTYATSSNGADNTANAINSTNGRANNGLAIDATAFGAMTAGQIQVIGTAAGMGVRTDAQMAANTGDLLLSSNGDLTVNGSAAQQRATLQASGSVSMTGAHVGVTGYTINASGDVTSSGRIQSGGKLAVSAGGNVNVANTQSSGDAAIKGGANVTLGDVQTGGALSVSAQGNDGAADINLNGTSVVSGATNLQAARDINVNGQTNGGTLQATAQRNVNVNAALQTSGDLALSATQGNLNAGATVKSGNNLALTSGQNTIVTGQATAQNAVTVAAGEDLTVSGSLASGTTLAANVARDVSVPGALLVGTNAQVNAGRNVDVPGVVIVQQDGVINAQNNLTGGGSVAFGQNGTLATGQDVAFTGKLLANGLQVTAGNNASVADVQAGGAFSIAANGSTSNPAGGGDVSFNGNAAAVGATTVQAARDVIVNGTLAGGSQVALTAQRNLTVATSGTVQAVGDLAVAAVSGSVSSSGTVNGAANLSVSGAQDVALTGATSVTGDTTLTAGHDVVIGGTLAGQGAATLNAGHDVIAGGSSGFVKDASVTAANDLAVTGTLQGAAVSLTAGRSVALNNVQANNALQVTATGGTLAVNGLVASLSTASLSSGGDTSINGALQSANALSVTSGGNTSITGSVASNGNVTLANAAGSLTSTGNIQSGDNLLINAAQSVDLGRQGTSALGDLTVNAGQNLTMNGSVVAQGNGTLTAGGTIAGAATAAFGLAANVSSGGDTDLTGSLRGGSVQTTAGGSASLHDVQAASDLALASNNDLTITGAVTGGAAVALNAGQNIVISGSIQSANDTTLSARSGSLSSTGTIASNGALSAQAGSDINLGGTTSTALDTTLSATRDINVTGMLAGQGQGRVTAGRDIGGAGTMTFAEAATLDAGRDVAQGGLIQGQSVKVTAAGNIGVNNVESASTVALTSNGTNTVNGPGNVTMNGSVAAAGAVTATARNDVSVVLTGKIASGTTVNVNAQHDIDIAGAVESVGDTALAAQGSLNATGGINSGGKLNIATGLDLSLGASTSAVGDATLNAGRDALLNGLLIGEANGSVTAGRDIGGAGTQAFTQAATYTAQRDIALTGGVQANVINATGGNNAALHDVSSASTLTLSANGNAGGGDAAITGTATAPGAVTLSGARDVLVSGSLTTGDSLTLAALRDVSASGTLQTTAGDLSATAATGSIALTGTTTTSGALNLSSTLDTQLGGQINAAKDVTVQAGRDITLSGALAGQLGGTLTASKDIAGAGTAAFAQAAALNASHDLALTGALQGASVNVTGGNNAGLRSVQAVTGNVSLTANGNAGGGDVTLGGTATALGALAVQAARDVSVVGAINTGSTTTIDATRNIALADVNSAGDLTLAATSGNASAANVTTQGNLTGSSGQALHIAGATTVGGNAQLTSGGDMTLAGGVGAQNAGTLTAGGSISAASVAFGQQATLNAGASIDVTGAVATNGVLNATAGNDLSLGSAQAGGAIALQAQGHNGAGDVKVSGAVASGGAVTVNATRDATVGGNASSTGALAVSVGRNLTASGTVGANGDVTLTTTGGGLYVGGAITSQGNLNATSGGALTLNGELVNGNTTLTAGGTATLTGAFLGLGLATINAGGSVNGGGSLTFGKDITVSAGGGMALGAIQGAGQFSATSVGDMSLGATTAVGNVSAKSTGGSVSVGGNLQSGGNVTIQAAKSATVAGAVSSMGNVNVTGTQGNVSVAGVSSNGDTAMSTGQTLTLSGTSTVAGQFTLSGGNVTLSGSQGGSKNVSVTAQGTLDASGASMVSTQNMQFSGTNVTLGTAIVGGALTATASNQLSLVGAAVDAVGSATLTAGNGFYNASQVLSGGALYVSAPNVTNAASASLASTTTTTINATNFTNPGLVNGSTTNVTVEGGLNNSGGSLMAVNSLNINTGSLNNQNGIIFAGNPNAPGGPTTGDVSLTINGGNGSFYNAGGQLLAQRNMGISAMNMAFDPSQGTISQGGQLSITAGSISNTGTWNYGGQGVALTGIYGINNYGTMTGTAPLTLSTNGTFTNFGQVTGGNVTFNGTLNNVAGAVMHADGTLALNGNTTNRGTVEASGLLSVTGGNYDNQGATTQSRGDANFNIAGTLLNTGGSIFAGNNVNINAGAVVNDQTAPSGATSTSTTTVTNPSLLWSAVAGTQTYWYEQSYGGENGFLQPASGTTSATLGDLLSPTGAQAIGANAAAPNASQPVAGSGTVTFYERHVQVGMSSSGDSSVPVYEDLWYVGTGPDPTAIASVTLALPTINQTTTTQQAGTSGVISAGNSISLTANSLSNRGGQIAAQGNVTLNVQSLSNGAVAPASLNQSVQTIDQGQYSAFFAQLKSLGTIAVAGTGNASGTSCDAQNYCAIVDVLPPNEFNIAPGAAPTATGYTTSTFPTGMIAAGYNLGIYGGNLVNEGLLYAGNNVQIGAASLTNQGGNQQNYSTQTGCATGVPNSACGTAGFTRGSNPTTTTFGYSQNDATIYAGNDLVIAAGQINNTFGNLLAGHNIVIGGVGSTASSTTPASSLNNTSGNIVAGNNITLNVSGAITNNLPPPVPVHENYGSKEQYSGCMTAGGYKESYCEGYVDQQSGSSSVISAGNNLQINAGSLTNIGSLIAAGNTATISVAGPVVNEAQTLNAYWHSHWVQETGMFSSDKRHDVWACGSPAECTALYGSAYTSTGGTIDPPQPVGNIAATIQAPNLTITSGGQIENVGNVIGTSVTLTGQKLINGITTANTYTPRVNAPSQVISLSPVSLPGLNLSVPRAVGGALPTPVAGKASFVDNSLGSSALGSLGPQDLLTALPANLQPNSTLFYYNPQEEDLMLQQAALQQTGKASFIDGLSYDSKRNTSVTEQEKAYLYQNALDYATTNNLQLGTALTQTQINALDKPMLWYVEQTVPDPSCTVTGTATCPTITALMPQVYLPSDTSAMSAGGNISGRDVTLNFGKGSGGSILNTGSITASDTLTVNTDTLTNQANQVDVGQIWAKVKGGYVDTTGTTVQPGGFMSAANMDLNVQTISQIGGALQQLNADGTVNQAGTQALLTQLQSQLGTNFTQTSVSDNLHIDFVKDGGGLPTFVVAAIAIAASIVTAGAAAAALGVALASMSLPMAMTVGALSAMAGSAAGQLASGNGFSLGSMLEAGVVGALTAGAFSAMGAGSQGLQQIGSKIANGTATMADIGQALVSIGERGLVNAGVSTAVYGGSFGNALENSVISDVGAIGAAVIGAASTDKDSVLAERSPGYVMAHAGLGCVLSAADGNGCAGGAIGGAAGAFLNTTLDANGNIPAPLDVAMTTMVGGLLAGALGANAQGAATAAENETLNNWLNHVRPGPMQLSEQERSDAALAACNQGDAASCSTYKSLQATSQQRDADLANACAGGFSSPGCRAQVAAALAGGNNVQPVNGTMYAFDPNGPAIKALPDNYQSIYAGSFDGQIAQSTLDGLQMAPIPLTGAGVFGKIGSWLGLGTADAGRLAEPMTTLLDGSGGAINNGLAGSVANANFAQSSINAAGTFSVEGAAKYTQLAGVPINTVDDLAAAIKNGLINPSQLPVDYVVTADGAQLILNTRTSTALSRAGVPKSQWYGVNQTGIQVPGMPAGATFNDLAAGQLRRNDLPPTGTSKLP